jgi:hypothetical protein
LSKKGKACRKIVKTPACRVEFNQSLTTCFAAAVAAYTPFFQLYRHGMGKKFLDSPEERNHHDLDVKGICSN